MSEHVGDHLSDEVLEEGADPDVSGQQPRPRFTIGDLYRPHFSPAEEPPSVAADVRAVTAKAGAAGWVHNRRLPTGKADRGGVGEELWCERTDVGDVAPLAALQKLHTLLLNRTRVVDLSPLAQCCALEVINVHATRVRSVAVLAPCARLSRVMALACAELSDEDVEALRTRTASSALRVRHSRG